MHYVYVLKSLKDNQLYTGYTSDLKKRIKEHNAGLSEATKYRIPLVLVYAKVCRNKTDALHREKYLKSSWGKCYLKHRLKNDFSA